MNKRTKHPWKLCIPLILVLALFLTTPALAETIPTIASDLPDYAPGEIVTLSGTGWQAGETVHIFVNDEIDSTWSRSVDVVVGEDGSITDTFDLPTWFVAVYNVTATNSSGLTAVTTFTDANILAKLILNLPDVQIDVMEYTVTSCSGTPSNSRTSTLTTTAKQIASVTKFQSLRVTGSSVYGYDFVKWTIGTAAYETKSYCLSAPNGQITLVANYRESAPPETTITGNPASLTNNSSASFSFAGSDDFTAVESLEFECSLDGATFEACTSPMTYSSLADGSHTFEVRAKDTALLVDPTPASFTWIVDTVPPEITLLGDLADGGSYYFGSVPAAPTCSASDASGLEGDCLISGYSNTVGSHTVTASATDKAGNTASDSITYTVLPWTLSGFYAPVDMGNGVFNVVKGGSTVPMKFEVFAGTTELIATSVVKSFVSSRIPCESTAVLDTIEVTTSGITSLRYDVIEGQFIQNWQTPKTPGVCYKVTMTTQDGSSLVANFKLK